MLVRQKHLWMAIGAVMVLMLGMWWVCVAPAVEAAPPVNAQVTYHSYDAPSGWVAFRIVNQPGGITLESVEATIQNRTSGAGLYGPAVSNTPFRPGATSNTLNDKLSPGGSAYLRYKLAGNPTGIPCRATIKLYSGNNRGGTSATKTIDFQLPGAAATPTAPPPPPVNAQVTYHSYQAPAGWVVFRVVNQPGGITLDAADATIQNRSNGAGLYGPATSNSPFHPAPTSDALNDKLAPGASAYLRYKLSSTPAGAQCRATIKLYAANNQGGASATKTIEFQLPAAPPPPPINAQVAYHSYDLASGWVTFRVTNQPGGMTLEAASAAIQNRSSGAGLYGPATSNSPFHPAPTSDALNDKLAPGAQGYLRYKLSGNPSGIPCRATLTLYTGNNQGGTSATKTVDFQLPAAPPPPPVNAQVTYHSYQAPDGWVVFLVANQPGGITLESVEATVQNRTTGASLYGPAFSDSPFHASPVSADLNDKLAPGGGAYLRYKLSSIPAGAPCRATIKLYTGNNRTGTSATKTIDFQLPVAPPPPVVSVNANITYHSYDQASGWVTFQIVNAPAGAVLECVAANIDNRANGAHYYGGYSDTPFKTNPASIAAEGPNMPPGTTMYLRFKLAGNPTGVPCRATLSLYTANGQGGASATRTVDFQLPGGGPPPPPVNAQVTYHSYQLPDGWAVFQVMNQPGGMTLEAATAAIVNRTTGASLYGPATSDSPFHASPVSADLNDKLVPGGGAYLRYKLTGSPTAIPCRATITLFTGNNQGGTSGTKTIDFNLPAAPPPPVVSVNANITYHSYDAASGWVTFQIVNAPAGAVLECVAANIDNRANGAHYYGGYSDTPFKPDPLTTAAVGPSMPPGATMYLRFKLAGNPTGVPCRATLSLYTANGQGGASATRTVDFQLPGGGPPPPPVNAQVTYHSYQLPDGWVVFQVMNQPGGMTLEAATAAIVNRTTGASLYGPATSDSPFHASPVSADLNDKLVPGGGAYLRYRLTGSPTAIPCRATITLFTGNNQGGTSGTKTIDFDLPAAPPPPVVSVNANITYHSYDAASGWVTFQIVNAPTGAVLECVAASIDNRTNGARYYAGYSDTPFKTNPASIAAEGPNMPPGTTRYLRFKLAGNPTGVPCRATISVYTANAQGGASGSQSIEFDLPGGAAGLDANLIPHSYDKTTGWVTFQVVNASTGAPLECAEATIQNRTTGEIYYGPNYYSNTPFRSSATSNVLVDTVASGETKFMRYRLTGNPAGVPCRATIVLYTGNGKTGLSATKVVNFDLAN